MACRPKATVRSPIPGGNHSCTGVTLLTQRPGLHIPVARAQSAASSRGHDHPQLGAYGLAVDCPPFPAERLQPVPASAEHWSLELALGSSAAPPDDQPHPEAKLHHTHRDAGGEPLPLGSFLVSAERAEMFDGHALLTIDRAEQHATLHTERIDAGAEGIVHPTLAAIRAAVAQWRGELALHAGGVIIDGAAWALLAGRGSGKSTTLAAASEAGHPVVADDLFVVGTDLHVPAGPRCVDLRAESEARFPGGRTLPVRDGTRARIRLPLPAAPASSPVAGFVTLAWGDEVRLDPVAPGDRLAVAAAAVTLPGTPLPPRLLLDVAAMPSWVLRRPQSLDALDEVLDVLATLRRP